MSPDHDGSLQPAILKTKQDLSAQSKQWLIDGKSSAIVPTMGALHAGHLSLIEKAKEIADHVIVSIFVNPKQFAVHEDLDTYPEDIESDLIKLAPFNVSAVYQPSRNEMYGQNDSTMVHMEGPAMAGLEDKYRPHFFDGVATVVAKLLISARAQYAVFGEKDFQQLKVVTQMTRDLGIGTEIISSPTIREADGLAMSSRNVYLSSDERKQASLLNEVLNDVRQAILTGQMIDEAIQSGELKLTNAGFKVDYLTLRHAETLAETYQEETCEKRILVAAHLGKTRLIDNIAL